MCRTWWAAASTSRWGSGGPTATHLLVHHHVDVDPELADYKHRCCSNFANHMGEPGTHINGLLADPQMAALATWASVMLDSGVQCSVQGLR